ncbi:hypothetical protein DFA_01314 [Cavenderia fasciculata]|uniref:Uncharacterized protein n=1 Tax=Cavenderia fasciculata TaxID=261658 RepID=F4PS47_CACFS|nr:uncharacterized protein DFA_01314 [Cavenderia fasciculata]EGG21430.1 hypothetical protein DFA_01314 [Cavenderia fasciculata]|eukprot:XP_004359280.1 hypothetical protein DFA_01314 [Cavenderia fasciculata]
MLEKEIFLKVINHKYLFRVLVNWIHRLNDQDTKTINAQLDQRTILTYSASALLRVRKYEQIRDADWLINNRHFVLMEYMLKSGHHLHFTPESIKMLAEKAPYLLDCAKRYYLASPRTSIEIVKVIKCIETDPSGRALAMACDMIRRASAFDDLHDIFCELGNYIIGPASLETTKKSEKYIDIKRFKKIRPLELLGVAVKSDVDAGVQVERDLLLDQMFQRFDLHTFKNYISDPKPIFNQMSTSVYSTMLHKLMKSPSPLLSNNNYNKSIIIINHLLKIENRIGKKRKRNLVAQKQLEYYLNLSKKNNQLNQLIDENYGTSTTPAYITENILDEIFKQHFGSNPTNQSTRELLEKTLKVLDDQQDLNSYAPINLYKLLAKYGSVADIEYLVEFTKEEHIYGLNDALDHSRLVPIAKYFIDTWKAYIRSNTVLLATMFSNIDVLEYFLLKQNIDIKFDKSMLDAAMNQQLGFSAMRLLLTKFTPQIFETLNARGGHYTIEHLKWLCDHYMMLIKNHDGMVYSIKSALVTNLMRFSCFWGNLVLYKHLRSKIGDAVYEEPLEPYRFNAVVGGNMDMIEYLYIDCHCEMKNVRSMDHFGSDVWSFVAHVPDTRMFDIMYIHHIKSVSAQQFANCFNLAMKCGNIELMTFMLKKIKKYHSLRLPEVRSNLSKALREDKLFVGTVSGLSFLVENDLIGLQRQKEILSGAIINSNLPVVKLLINHLIPFQKWLIQQKENKKEKDKEEEEEDNQEDSKISYNEDEIEALKPILSDEMIEMTSFYIHSFMLNDCDSYQKSIFAKSLSNQSLFPYLSLTK